MLRALLTLLALVIVASALAAGAARTTAPTTTAPTTTAPTDAPSTTAPATTAPATTAPATTAPATTAPATTAPTTRAGTTLAPVDAWAPPSGAAFATVSAGALDGFHAAWCAATPVRPLVVVQLGDSHTAGGFMTTALRRALAPEQPSGPGYVPPSSLTTQWATSTLRGRWTQASWLRDRGDVSGAMAGPGGQIAVPPSRGPATAELRLGPPPATTTATTATTATPMPPSTASDAPILPEGGRVTVLHDPFTPVPDGALRIDGVVTEPWERAGTALLGRTTVSVPPGTTTVSLDVAGEPFRFYGWVVLDPTARVELDAVGVSGVTVMQSGRRADASLDEYLAWRQPDLVVVWLGTNDAVTPADEFRRFDDAYPRWLDRVRAAAPQAALVAVGPPDLDRRPAGCAAPVGRGRRRRGGLSREELVAVVCRPQAIPVTANRAPIALKGVRTAADWGRWLSSCAHETAPTLAHVIDVERAAVTARGGAFVDLFAWMGGPLSMKRLACLEPPLAALDLVHLKADGYALVGAAVADALTGGVPCPAAPPPTTAPTTPTTTPAATTNP